MRKFIRKSHLISVLVLVVLSACSNSSASPSQDSDGATASTTTTIPIPTTVPWKEGAPEAAWAAWLTTFAVIDASEISESECGVFAMLVTDESLTFYSWDGVQWSDKSDVLLGGRGKYPQKVYSSDYTNDGVIDFFVTYRTDAFGTGLISTMGAILQKSLIDLRLTNEKAGCTGLAM
jgi:hypothetical protein